LRVLSLFLITNNTSKLFGRCLVQLLARTLGVLTVVLHSFPQYLTVHSRMVPLLGYDHFLPNPFQFIFNQSYHLVLNSLKYCEHHKKLYWHNSSVTWKNPTLSGFICWKICLKNWKFVTVDLFSLSFLIWWVIYKL
jgi:hypothetical protein